MNLPVLNTMIIHRAGNISLQYAHNIVECFGQISSGKMILSESWLDASKIWNELPEHFSFVSLDEFVVMPNQVSKRSAPVSERSALISESSALISEPSALISEPSAHVSEPSALVS
jgi:hypothetical protein